MRKCLSFRSVVQGILLLALFSVLAACNLQPGASDGSAAAAAVNPVELSGSVGDGPVTGATVMVYGSDGNLLGSIQTDSTADFHLTLNVSDSQYPLKLVVNGGVDLVTGAAPDFVLESVVFNPADTVVNINPFSRFVVQLAESMPGGLTAGNVATAQTVVRNRLGFGLDSDLVADPITSTINAGNVAALVKASESLGELVRRIRDATGASADAVIEALASDLVDGLLDGQGAGATDAGLSAVANVLSSQVLVETLTNSLRVGGVPAAGILDQAIRSTTPGIANSQLTGSVLVNEQLLAQTRAAIAAAQVLDNSAPVQGVAAVLAGLTSGSTSAQVAGQLPPQGSVDVLQQAVNLVAGAAPDQIEQVNSAAASAVTNASPQIAGSPLTVATAGVHYGFQPQATDADGDTLSFSIVNKPSWATFNTTTGALSGTPGDVNVGSYPAITISVTDGIYSTSLPAFGIAVEAAPVVNTAPQISGSPDTSAMVGVAYSFTPSATDAQGDALTFSISHKPAWASFDAATGTLSGMPGSTGTYGNIVISVSDGQLADSLPAFAVTVEAAPVVNTAPQISGSPDTSVMVDTAYSFTPSASDAEADTLSFSISHKPAWASFNTGTGRMSGTPGSTGTYSNIMISVSDGQASVSLPAFSIEVTAAPNQAPSISGTPATSVTANAAYLFQPVASDPEGDSLTYSISHKPAWASFNTTTGALGGTPFNADAGSYPNIVISVSDGQASVSLPAFSIQVLGSNGGFSLSWTAPVTRSDGSPLSLSDIGGYRVYLGQSSGSYTTMIDVADGSATSTTIDSLAAGTWYVSMSTYDGTGVEGSKSGEIIKTAQ
jgi:Putative Ig domain